MDRKQAERLIAELGQLIGLPGLALDANGTCRVSFEAAASSVALAHYPRAGELHLVAGLDNLEPSPRRLAEALAANFCWRPAGGAVFGFDPASGRLVLEQRCPNDVHADELARTMRGFVTQLVGWTERLTRIGDESPAPAADERPPVRLPIPEFGAVRA